MDRKQVSSSTIHSIGYSTEDQILEVEFLQKTIYEYYKVPLAEYNALMGAKSHGSYFNKHIKDRYRFTQVK